MIEAAKEIFVARQPIFDSKQNVYAYELLYRNSTKNACEAVDATSATLSVIRDTFLILGTRVTGSKKVFINFNRDLLEQRGALTLRPENTVIEITEDVEPDTTVIEACTELKEGGFTLALDDYDLKRHRGDALIELADIIKVDFRTTTPEERRSIVRSLHTKKVQFLAEKVENLPEFGEAKEAGYLYFQGYFFGKPVIVSAKNISGYKLNYIQMLSELNQKELDFQRMEKIIMRDTYFSYTLLNYMNSAFFGFRDEISSIRQALVLLGEHEVRKWASLVILTFIGSDKPPEVTALSLVRAKFCELLAPDIGVEGHESELFIMGMFSLLDVLVGRPMTEIVEKINLSENIKLALIGAGNRYRDILDMVLHYEKGEWDQFLDYANRLSADTTRTPAHYSASIEWAEQILNSPIATTSRKN